MEKQFVIKRKNLPTRLPLWTTLLAYLFLDKLQVSELVWGIVGTIFVLGWVGAIIMLVKEEQVDISKLLSKKEA